MSINLQTLSDGSGPPPVSPPTSGDSLVQGATPPPISPPYTGLSLIDGTTPPPVSPPGQGPSLLDTGTTPAWAPWMPDLTITGAPSGVADFINNGGNYGFPGSPLPETNGFSANWLTEAINSGSPADSLIDQGSDSSGWGYGRNPHGTVTAQILQNFLHLGSNG
jgi:hypothetical protein